MKKIIILSLISSFLLAEYKYTRVIKKNDENQYTSGELKQLQFNNVSGKVFSLTRYDSHIRVIIEDSEKGRIKLSLNPRSNIKDNSFVSGYCNKFEFDEYSKCNLNIRN